MVNEKIKEILKPIIAEAYEEGYKKCLTDIVERCDFIYEVIADKAKMDVYDALGAIEFPEVTEEEWEKTNIADPCTCTGNIDCETIKASQFKNLGGAE